LPLARRTLNSVQVALDVWDRFPWVTTATARVPFEHAFVAQWTFLTPDALEHFMRHVEHSKLGPSARTQSEPSLASPDLRCWSPTAIWPTSTCMPIDSQSAAASVAGTSRPCYLASRSPASSTAPTGFFSSAVHPSTGTLAAHLAVSGVELPRVQQTGSGVADRLESALGLALAALWALNFVEKCAPAFLAPGRAGAIAVLRNLPYDLAHSDRGSPKFGGR
jgi:hypothetical protein